MSDLASVISRITEFRDERDWAQFHDSKNLALAIAIEAAELNELFLWKGNDDPVSHDRLSEELADVLIFSLLLAEKNGIDPVQAILNKIQINEKKYPVELSKGVSTKYKDLQQ